MKRFSDIAGKPRHINGWKKDRPDHRDMKFKVSFWKAVSIPNESVIPKEGELKVEDQGDIGSCTCNSGTTGLEFCLDNAGIKVQLSRLAPYAKVRVFEGTPLTEDSGAQIRDVMKVLSSYGSPLETSWPYEATRWQQMPPASLDAEAQRHRLTFYYRCPTLMTILASIAQGFPVVGGFSCPESMFTEEVAKTGIIPVPKPSEGFEGGHAVLFTGYSKKTNLIRFMNSWSVDWGDKGFGYLPFDYVRKGWADDFWTQRAAGAQP